MGNRIFLTGALLFWGWQVQLLWMAVLLALVLAGAALQKNGFDLDAADFNKFVDITTILLTAAIVIALNDNAQTAIWTIFKWLPAILFPVLAVQAYSHEGKIPARSFFITARKRKPFFREDDKEIDVTFAYVLFCILPAGAVQDNRPGIFFAAVVFFSIWALWQVRSKRIGAWVWILCVVSVIAAGYIGHKVLYKTGLKINRMIYLKYAGRYLSNPFKSHTAMGTIGRLKLSPKILMRVKPEQMVSGKTWLLHNSTYNYFLDTKWFSRESFSQVLPPDEDDYWRINPDLELSDRMTVYQASSRKRALLNLPAGTMRLYGLTTGKLEKNPVQVLRLKDAPSLTGISVVYSGQPSFDMPPDDRDLKIPAKEEKGLLKIAGQMRISGIAPSQVPERMKHYFSTHYQYTLELEKMTKTQTPLQDFLFHTKAGHCELFATATVLLLRQAGIPARYATGFMAHEYSSLEKMVVVRQRDAHAWAKAFVDGKWQNVDTTPAAFLDYDSRMVAAGKVTDLFSFVKFQIMKFKLEIVENLFARYGLWLILPLVVMLFFRLKRSGGLKRVDAKKDEPGPGKHQEDHHGFYLLEKKLSKAGLERFDHETYPSWLDRVSFHFRDEKVIKMLMKAAMLHDRYRFGPDRLNSDQEQTLKSTLEMLLHSDLLAETPFSL